MSRVDNIEFRVVGGQVMMPAMLEMEGITAQLATLAGQATPRGHGPESLRAEATTGT